MSSRVRLLTVPAMTMNSLMRMSGCMSNEVIQVVRKRDMTSRGSDAGISSFLRMTPIGSLMFTLWGPMRGPSG